MINTIIIIAVSTFFCIGYLPLIPGTFGSIAGLSLLYLARASEPLYLGLTFIIIIAGLATCGKAEIILNKKDSGHIVIDEIAGMLLSFIFVPHDPGLVMVGFLLFRLLDTIKPYPANKLQDLGGSIGIMGDDIIAGLYTNIILQALLLAGVRRWGLGA